MTQATSKVRLVCLGVIASLFFGTVTPSWAQEEEAEHPGEADYKDPTIIDEDSTSVPDGVKVSAKEEAVKRKEIKAPIYGQWWFWASTIAAAGAWIAFSVIPMHRSARTCGPGFTLGCVGDGRN